MVALWHTKLRISRRRQGRFSSNKDQATSFLMVNRFPSQNRVPKFYSKMCYSAHNVSRGLVYLSQNPFTIQPALFSTLHYTDFSIRTQRDLNWLIEIALFELQQDVTRPNQKWQLVCVTSSSPSCWLGLSTKFSKLKMNIEYVIPRRIVHISFKRLTGATGVRATLSKIIINKMYKTDSV